MKVTWGPCFGCRAIIFWTPSSHQPRNNQQRQVGGPFYNPQDLQAARLPGRRVGMSGMFGSGNDRKPIESVSKHCSTLVSRHCFVGESDNLKRSSGVILFYQILSSVKKFLLERPPKFKKVGVVCLIFVCFRGKGKFTGMDSWKTHPKKQIVDPLTPDTRWGWYSYLHIIPLYHKNEPCIYGGFLKWWVSPTTMGKLLLKMISTWGVKWGYHHLRKHPYRQIFCKYTIHWVFGYQILPQPACRWNAQGRSASRRSSRGSSQVPAFFSRHFLWLPAVDWIPKEEWPEERDALSWDMGNKKWKLQAAQERSHFGSSL